MSSRAAGNTDQPILEELSSFYRDDMEFRTVTAMLNLLSRGEYDLENHWNPSEYSRFYLKTMASVGALMDRTGGEVAIMAKRTGKGMTLFVSSTALAKDQDAQDEYVHYPFPIIMDSFNTEPDRLISSMDRWRIYCQFLLLMLERISWPTFSIAGK
jgi:hypothetical protein